MGVKKARKKIEKFSDTHYVLMAFVIIAIAYVLTLIVFLFEKAAFYDSTSYAYTRVATASITALGLCTVYYGIKKSIHCFQGLYELKSTAICSLITGTGLACVSVFIKIIKHNML